MKTQPFVRCLIPRPLHGASSLLLACLAAAVAAPQLVAQSAAPAAPPAPEGEAVLLNQYVVTGSVTPRTQLESPVAISNLDRGRIEDLGPRNFAELLKAVPGIYVESTGGEAFNNVSIRGIGTTSGFSYEMLYEDGLPVLATNNLRHGLPDAWTRMSTFVENVEAMRSGTSNIFASQAPLALINLISREGGTNLQGEATLTASDYGTLRTDLWVSGPAGTNTTFALGGWYRVDDGVRDPGFTANKGGEIMGNVKHTFEGGRGHIKASFKLHKDHNVFDLPMPLTGGSNFRSVPFGPNIKSDSTSATADQRILTVSSTPVGLVNFDLADGIYSKMNYVGTEAQFKLSDSLTLENRNRYSDGYRSIDYIFNGVATSWQSVANAAAGRSAAQFAAGLSGGNYSFRLSYPGQNNVVAAPNAAAAATLGNGFGNRKSWQHSGGLVTDFQDDLRLIGSFNDGHTTATGGVYYSFLREEQHYLFSTLLTDVTPEVHRVDITILDATTGAAIGPATFNGIYHFGDQYRNSTGEDREVSPYALIEHKVGPFTIDAGLRHNNTRQVLTREFTASTFVTNSSLNPALQTGQFGTGNFETRKNSASETAGTVGANYAFTKKLAFYGRISRGVRTLGITEFADDIVAGRPASPSRIVKGYEVGLKYGSNKLGVVFTLFQEDIKGIQDTQVTILPNGTIGPTVVAIQSEKSTGAELETIWSPVSGLSLGVNATVQDPKWTDHNLKTQTLSTGQVVAFDEHGLRPERTPKFYGKVMAGYRFPATTLGTFALNASYQYTGERPVDRANGPINPLTSFGETQVGVSFITTKGFSVRVSINNVFDEVALSEGDPRGGTNVLDPTLSVFNARPIQPRTITATVSYRF
ncbi:MAG: TonB-dependent receptor [Opitutus sp.]